MLLFAGNTALEEETGNKRRVQDIFICELRHSIK